MRFRQALLAPLRRDCKRDFAHGGGAELLVAKVEQVLGTEGDTPRSSGELPWRTAFGAAFHLLRHRNADEVLRELARVYARDALARWLPEVKLLRCDVDASGSALFVRLAVSGDERPDAAADAVLSLRD